MRMKYCIIRVILFITVATAENIELKDAVIAVPGYYNSGSLNVGELKRIVDGDAGDSFHTKCIAASRVKGKAWFQLDMLREINIKSVELLTRSDITSQLSDFKIYATKVGEVDDTKLCAKQNGNSSNKKFVKYDCNKVIRGRYLTVISTAQYLSLCEVKVDGVIIKKLDTYVDLKDATANAAKTWKDKPVNRIVNGDTSQLFEDKCTASQPKGKEEIAWFEIDMGTTSSVGSVELLARKDQSGLAQLSNFEIYIAQKDKISEDNFCAQAGNDAVLNEFNIYPCVKQLRGRHITIRKVNAIGNDMYLSLCEVRVNKKGSKRGSDKQIDLLDAVVAVGQYWNSKAIDVGQLKRIVDGNTQNQDFQKYCIAAQIVPNKSSWFQIDLLKDYRVTSLQILGRADVQTQLGNFEIYLSKEGDTKPSRLCAKQEGEADNKQFVDYKCKKALRTRYITIRSTAQYLAICELKVYGTLFKKLDTFVDLVGAEVTTGSSFSNYLPERIVNTDTSQSFGVACFAAQPKGNSGETFLQIDMKDTTLVGSVELLARRDGYGVQQLRNFDIYVTENKDYGDKNLCAKGGSDTSLNEFNIYSCEKQLRGRYITIRKPKATGQDIYISICEVRVNKKGSKKDVAEKPEGGDSETDATCVRKKQCAAPMKVEQKKLKEEVAE